MSEIDPAEIVALLNRMLDVLEAIPGTTRDVPPIHSIEIHNLAYALNGRISIAGDSFRDISGNATIVNRSELQNSLNDVKRYDLELGRALEEILELVESSNAQTAQEYFEVLVQELARHPRRTLPARSMWEGLRKALPDVESLSRAVGVVTDATEST